MIVEADAAVRDACARAADRLGCVAYSTAYIDDFQVVLDQLHPSLIVLDLNMLGRGGADLLNHLVDSQSGARVLLLSGKNQRVRTAAQILASSIGLSGVCVLQKPEAQADLEQALQRSIREAINLEQPVQSPSLDDTIATAEYAH